MELEFTEESSRAVSVQFSGEFVQPDVECRALLSGQISEDHAHAESGMRVDDRAGKLTRAAAVPNSKADVRVFGKRVDRVNIAAPRAQFRDTRAILHTHDLRFGDKRKARSRSSHDVGSFGHGFISLR